MLFYLFMAQLYVHHTKKYIPYILKLLKIVLEVILLYSSDII